MPSVTSFISLSRYQWRNQHAVSLTILSAVCLCILYTLLHIQPDTPRWIKTQRLPDRRSFLGMVKNETLGFQKILCINLPSRTDKRDAIMLGSSLTQFHIDWVEGVSGDAMDPKAYPPRLGDLGRPRMLPGEIGSWRAHMNAIQKVVSEQLTSALIIEDDIDWDVTLKNQLQEFALGSRAVQRDRGASGIPYGGDWDLLWLGHCGITCHSGDPFYMMHDQTAVPRAHLPHYWQGPAVHKTVDNTNETRVICRISNSVCSYAYALTYHAAQKLLAVLSVSPFHQAMPPGEPIIFDVLLGRLCKIGYLKCISSYPSLIGAWRPAGSRSRHSDIQELQDPAEPDTSLEEATSLGVKYSTMLNIPTLIDNGSLVRSSVADVPNPKLNLSDVQPMEGGLYKLEHGGVLEIEG
ncbi:hypothetical protein BDV28DRAFT_142409 [Aspergillus coremiiformis]|uniref:LPS glycosyltransferase n=1 Tax=Aspergillus coremiiformis TaxID=138285 RepID=A0A5N6YW87_9EURO|nr:hypothetical protein BDV28DRAFT_142409 [Aspergillus coremiiformis]